jgi:hypothetical protein
MEENPCEHLICGYKVYFPEGRKPFPAQLAVISKVLQALKDKKNALLESPTGTGKVQIQNPFLHFHLLFQNRHWLCLQVPLPISRKLLKKVHQSM